MGFPGDRSGTRATEPAGDRIERQVIAARSLADDRLERDVVQVVDLPERFAPGGIREVDLDERALDGEQGVAQRDARVGQAAALTIATSKSRRCNRSISAPSWLDWKKATLRPSSVARALIPAWI
jgi:hypothetical protein